MKKFVDFEYIEFEFILKVLGNFNKIYIEAIKDIKK